MVLSYSESLRTWYLRSNKIVAISLLALGLSLSSCISAEVNDVSLNVALPTPIYTPTEEFISTFSLTETPEPTPMAIPISTAVTSYFTTQTDDDIKPIRPLKLKLLTCQEKPTNITLPSIFNSGPSIYPRVAISIDDLNQGNLAKVLAIAKERNAKMTLFPEGRRIISQAALIRQAVLDGNEIGDHTETHPLGLLQLPIEKILEEMSLPQDHIDKILGYHYPMRLFRPPGGNGGYFGGDKNFVTIVNTKTYRKEPQSLVMWSLSVNARSGTTYEDMYLKAFNGAIILLHDSDRDVAHLPQIIDELQKRGFVLVTVSGLFCP